MSKKHFYERINFGKYRVETDRFHSEPDQTQQNYGGIRQFFKDRGVLEVETPALSEFSVTDVHLSTFSTQFLSPFSSEAKNIGI
ncbi:lysyl-tRNA synthetase [Actinobacillus pleuropneumoniae]|nr:lysyl-tRNA synthetase [Actinobacillus pleuropneumoniae]